MLEDPDDSKARIPLRLCGCHPISWYHGLSSCGVETSLSDITDTITRLFRFEDVVSEHDDGTFAIYDAPVIDAMRVTFDVDMDEYDSSRDLREYLSDMSDDNVFVLAGTDEPHCFKGADGEPRSHERGHMIVFYDIREHDDGSMSYRAADSSGDNGGGIDIGYTLKDIKETFVDFDKRSGILLKVIVGKKNEK